ncbi:hypothetical protein L596_006808 [Steinernema carpocapsae]|uniref:Uncharacterized protein n=1 Tax=Steinernema carpocapsae TaxID=34508 RepID=A0A4U5P6X0_STECR|nr:hypothetical protein L596_006808 [Steinernema carpocapsae]
MFPCCEKICSAMVDNCPLKPILEKCPLNPLLEKCPLNPILEEYAGKCKLLKGSRKAKKKSHLEANLSVENPGLRMEDDVKEKPENDEFDHSSVAKLIL